MSKELEKPDRTNEINALLKLLELQKAALAEHADDSWLIDNLRSAALSAADFIKNEDKLKHEINQTEWNLTKAGYVFPTTESPCS